MPTYDPAKRHAAAVKAAQTRAANRRAAAHGAPPPRPVVPPARPRGVVKARNQNPFANLASKEGVTLAALAAGEKMLATYLADDPAKRADPEISAAFERYRDHKAMALGGLHVAAERHAWLRRSLLDLTTLISKIL